MEIAVLSNISDAKIHNGCVCTRVSMIRYERGTHFEHLQWAFSECPEHPFSPPIAASSVLLSSIWAV